MDFSIKNQHYEAMSSSVTLQPILHHDRELPKSPPELIGPWNQGIQGFHSCGW